MSLKEHVQNLHSSDEKTRLRAIYQLAILGASVTLKDLKMVFDNDSNPELRTIANAAAHHIQQTSTLDQVSDAKADLEWVARFDEFLGHSAYFSKADVDDLIEATKNNANQLISNPATATPVSASAFGYPPSPSSAEAYGYPPSPSSTPNAYPPSPTRGTGTTGTYEMLWDCGWCGSEKLLGVTHRYCPNCGGAQDPKWRYFPKPGEEVALENHVYHGVDVICPSCQTANSAKAEFCINCGTPLTDAAKAKLVESGQDSKRDLVKEGFQADMSRIVHDEKEARRNEVVFAGVKRKNVKWVAALVGLFIIGGGIAFALFYRRSENVTVSANHEELVDEFVRLFYRRSENVTVSAHEWEYVIQIQELDDVDKRSDGICSVVAPSDAYNERNTTEVRTRRVADGQDCEQVCTNRRVDNGDGSFRTERDCRQECTTRYRDEQYMVDVCAYKVDEYVNSREVKTAGEGLEPAPYWPEPTLEAGSGSRNLGQEREGSREENYMVIFERGNGKTFDCEFKTMDEWTSFAENTRYSVEFNVLGKALCSSLQKN